MLHINTEIIMCMQVHQNIMYNNIIMYKLIVLILCVPKEEQCHNIGKRSEIRYLDHFTSFNLLIHFRLAKKRIPGK